MQRGVADIIPKFGKYPFQVYPEHLAFIPGMVRVGRIFYVDASTGNDSNDGLSPDNAVKTLTKAYDLVTTNAYDVIVVAPAGTSGTAEVATITWAKNHVTVIGATAPVGISQRARVVFTVDSTDPCLTVSGVGNSFVNLQFATFQDSNDVLVSVTGSRNYFDNVHFAGIGTATCGDDATARCLVLSGAQECRFVGCNFGLDTVMRSTTNATVELASSASRNVFESCRFIMAADNVGPNHLLLTGSSAIDRWVEFKDCVWYSFWTNDADKVTHAIDAAAQTATGHILLTGQQVLIGFDDWEASDSGKVYLTPASATANAIGIAINPNVS
jgi:hypothetical protein